jgi:murein DD-endopeptidase MepM/ murein hydrolase activator NlpD
LLSQTNDEKRVLFVVTQGDTLSRIFERAKVNRDFFSNISDRDLERISSLHPGDLVEVTTDKKGNIITMAKTVRGQKNTWVTVDKRGNQYTASQREMSATYQDRYVRGTVDSNNLFVAARGLSIEQPVTREFIEIMKSQIDIPKQLKRGDTFKISYRQMMLNSRPVGEPIIVGAVYEESMTLKRHTAFRYRDSRGTITYYNIDGQPVNGAAEFDEHPMRQYSRISSRFNPARRHPVTGRVRPHNGTDYAAPTGTPIYAPSDGTITFVGRQGGFGNLIKISHGNNTETLYAHLSRFENGMRNGTRVSRGQRIGYVGATGMVTGPHLHYELHINGRPVDSLIAKKDLVGGQTLKGQELAEFRRVTAPMYRRMASLNDDNKETFVTQNWDIESNNVLL